MRLQKGLVGSPGPAFDNGPIISVLTLEMLKS